MRFKKVLLTLLVLAVGAGIASGAWYYIYNRNMVQANETIQTLNSTIDSVGQMVSVYTLAYTVQSGDEIKEDDLVMLSMPSSAVHENWITDPSQIVGKYYKIDLAMYTPLTTDMVMDDQIDDTTREYDLCFDRWPVGLQVGDYVDVRLVMPYGEEYVVVPKVRIKAINANSVKANLTEEYWDMYTSALVDYYLHLDQGSSIYLSKYVEPGAQEAAIPYYAVRDNVKAIMQLNPNIIGLATTALSDELRNSIDTVLNNADAAIDKSSEDEQGALDSGRKAFNDNVNNDYTSNQQDEEEASEEAEQEAEISGTTEDTTAQEQLSDTVDQLQEGVLD